VRIFPHALAPPCATIKVRGLLLLLRAAPPVLPLSLRLGARTTATSERCGEDGRGEVLSTSPLPSSPHLSLKRVDG
jgi:hypothetical protein